MPHDETSDQTDGQYQADGDPRESGASAPPKPPSELERPSPVAEDPHARADDPRSDVVDEDQMDPANRSLAEALRISFALLQIVMLILVALFFVSGIFQVPEGTVAVHTRFGNILGEPGQQVLRPGTYFGLPEPVDDVIRIPTATQSVELDQAFFQELREGEATQSISELAPRGQLNPGSDGSLITGDKSIVMGRWTVTWRIEPRRAAQFVRNVGSMEKAAQIVHTAAEEAIVRTVAQTTVGEFYRGDINTALAEDLIQQTLDELDTGITVTSVLTVTNTPPIAVLDSFQAVAQAQSQRAQRIEEAREQRTQILNEAAGAAYRALDLAIDYYATARRAENQQKAQKGLQVINDLLAGAPASQALQPLVDDPLVDPQRLEVAMTPQSVSGDVARIIQEANIYQTRVVQQIRTEAELFQSLLPQYKQTPEIVLSRLWLNVREEIFAGDAVEIFYLPPDPDKQLQIEVNSDPDIQQELESQMYEQQAQRQPPERPERPSRRGR